MKDATDLLRIRYTTVQYDDEATIKQYVDEYNVLLYITLCPQLLFRKRTGHCQPIGLLIMRQGRCHIAPRAQMSAREKVIALSALATISLPRPDIGPRIHVTTYNCHSVGAFIETSRILNKK